MRLLYCLVGAVSLLLHSSALAQYPFADSTVKDERVLSGFLDLSWGTARNTALNAILTRTSGRLQESKGDTIVIRNAKFGGFKDCFIGLYFVQNKLHTALVVMGSVQSASEDYEKVWVQLITKYGLPDIPPRLKLFPTSYPLDQVAANSLKRIVPESEGTWFFKPTKQRYNQVTLSLVSGQVLLQYSSGDLSQEAYERANPEIKDY